MYMYSTDQSSRICMLVLYFNPIYMIVIERAVVYRVSAAGSLVPNIRVPLAYEIAHAGHLASCRSSNNATKANKAPSSRPSRASYNSCNTLLETAGARDVGFPGTPLRRARISWELGHRRRSWMKSPTLRLYSLSAMGLHSVARGM